MNSNLRSLLSDPRAPDAPRRVWRDWALVGVVAPIAVVEAVLRPELPWRWPTLALTLAVLAALLWRRTHPLAVVAACFGAVLALNVAHLVADPAGTPGPDSLVVIVVALYALARWGSGREVVVGGAIALTTATVGIYADPTPLSDAIAGFAFIGIVMLSGASVRFFDGARRRELEQVRSAEREHLARDLHDTVAHHVSAIAISAHAGLAVADARPAAAIDALHVISAEASRTLNEMRAMVGVLRREGPAELAPTPSLADLHRLTDGDATGAPLVVDISDDLGDVDASISTTVFRLAQESITNARRHARHPTRILVQVTGDDDCVRLQVTDDGARVDAPHGVGGYGVQGMIERAGMLGGTCDAGPGPAGGWVVTAELPRHRAPA